MQVRMQLLQLSLIILCGIAICAADDCPTSSVLPFEEECLVTTLADFASCDSSSVFNHTASIGTCIPCAALVTPGYVCKNQTVKLCSAGHYCPFNEDTDVYDQEIPCSEGFVCRPGFVAPVECRALVQCEAGAEIMTAGGGFLVAFIFMAVGSCCLGCCLQFRETKSMKASLALRDTFEEEHSSYVLGQDFKADHTPVTVEFKNVGMKLKAKGHREILAGVSGYYPPGSLVALMGPSGGGKTTFMNALLGRASYANVTGSVKINGVEGGLAKAANMVGFVPQDDIVHADLTVYQNVMFNALLRLPASTSKKAKIDHVQSVLNTLGLQHIQNDLVGSPEKRGVSGGQKKRVNIGMELAAMPSIVFMDEPTSGLDGAATMELALCLSKLRESGLTIICVIHQPRWSVFKLFSHLLLLGAGGKQVYGGRTEHLQQYLESLNFRIPEFENPADWMIDVVCGLSSRYLTGPDDGDAIDKSFTAPQTLYDIWAQEHAADAADPNSRWNAPMSDSKQVDPLKPRAVPNRFHQFYLLLTRVGRQHDNKSFAYLVGFLFCAGSLFGSMSAQGDFFYSAMYSSLSGGGAVTTTLAMVIGIKSHSLVFPEQLQFYREAKVGVSSVAYLAAKVFYDFIRTYFFVLAFVVPYFFSNMPMMPFSDYSRIWFGFAWFWSGAGLWWGVSLASSTTGLLLLIFVPSLEVFVNGSAGAALGYINEMGSVSYFLSCLTSGRWVNQALYAAELRVLPDHIMDFETISLTLTNSSITRDLPAAQHEAESWLWFLGFLWRALALLTLVLIKYSQGGGFFHKIFYVCAHQCSDKLGVSSLTSRSFTGAHLHRDHNPVRVKVAGTDGGTDGGAEVTPVRVKVAGTDGGAELTPM